MDCIHPKPGAPDFETAEQLYIDPEVCIDCDACVEACPVDAIFAGLRAAREVRLRARAQRGVLRRAEHRRAHRGVMAARATARGDRRRRAGRGVRRRLRCCARAATSEIDLFERLPTPWGLLRGGVAPDHQEIKRLEDTFDRQTLARGCRFLGNVEVGVDVSHAELMRHYTAVIYATGAQTDKSLGHPRRGPARQLGGHRVRRPGTTATPTTASSSSTCRRERAVVIGNGNVAADVTRMLTLSPRELERTDVADHALEALRESRIEEVVVLGRRGPAQAAFTSAELRELGRLDGVDAARRPRRGRARPGVARVARRGGHLHRAQERRAAARVRGPARAPDAAPARSSCASCARRSRSAATDRVEAVDVAPQRDRARPRTARCARGRSTRTVETIECGLVLRSVGYRAVPLPDVPFDERRFVLPNERGRVLDARRRAAARRLRGRLDQARPDRHPRHQQARRRGDGRAASSRTCAPARCRTPPNAGASRSTRCSPSASRTSSRPTAGAIDAHELERGRAEQRPRVKLASREELLAAQHATARRTARPAGRGRPTRHWL